MSNDLLQVIATRDIPQEEVGNLVRDLNAILPTQTGPTIVLFAAEPPSYLEIVGRAAAWIPLTAAATAFLVRLAQLAAESVWEDRRRLLNATLRALGRASAPLLEFARAVIARKRRLTKAKLGLGVQVLANPNWPAMLWIETDDEVELAYYVALIVAKSASVESEIQQKADEGQGPFGLTVLSVSLNGNVVVSWINTGGKRIDITLSERSNL